MFTLIIKDLENNNEISFDFNDNWLYQIEFLVNNTNIHQLRLYYPYTNVSQTNNIINFFNQSQSQFSAPYDNISYQLYQDNKLVFDNILLSCTFVNSFLEYSDTIATKFGSIFRINFSDNDIIINT